MQALDRLLDPSASSDLPVRRVTFDWSGVDVERWHPQRPEFACGANAISLLMPHAEPFVVRAVRDRSDAVTDDLVRERVDAWCAQESAHHAAHRRFNEQLTGRSRTARLLDRLAAWTFRRLSRRSPEFRVAFAGAFELVAFASARWAEAGLNRYFAGADERAATLFLWHLAEEVEHKGVVETVDDAAPTTMRRRVAATVAAFVALIGFTVVGGLALFVRSGYAHNPVRWARLVGWGCSLAFVLMPVLATSLTSGFRTEQLVDPPWMARWLLEYDAETRTMPLWTHAGSDRPPL